MRYPDFESIMSTARMSRYCQACGNDTRKAMTLYRKNLKLSQELFTVISCFEVALRNAIEEHYRATLGDHWLRDSIQPGARFDNGGTQFTRDTIEKALRSLGPRYTHPKLVAELGFGFWRFMFSRNQFRACGQTLLRIFPNKPVSTPLVQYNANYVLNKLAKVNEVRNRIAHHEPVCFQLRHPIVDTTFAQVHYNNIIQLFQWMQVDEAV